MPKCRKPRSKVQIHTDGSVTANGITCGKWVLRPTKSRLPRGQHLASLTPSQVPPKSKRHHISSATSSQSSCTGTTKNLRKSNPNAAPFRYKGLPHYDLLKQLFNKSVASGALEHSNNQPAPDSDEEEVMSMSQAQGLKGGTSSGSRGKRKSHEVDTDYAEKLQKALVFEKLGKFLDMRTSRLEKGEGAAGAECNQQRPPSHSISDAMRVLSDYANVIPMETYLKATNYFSINAEMRETFLHVEPVYRVAWLMGLP